MESARVGIFEDDQSWRKIVTEIIEDEGHTVAVAAKTIEEARAAIEDLKEDSLDVAVVDGNLDPNKSSGADGAEITRLLHEKLSTITVIGLSGSNQIVGADHNVSKVGDPGEEIPTIIASL